MNQGGQTPQNNPPSGNLGTGEEEAPLAQPPKFDVRTMTSDMSSMQSGEEHLNSDIFLQTLKLSYVLYFKFLSYLERGRNRKNAVWEAAFFD